MPNFTDSIITIAVSLMLDIDDDIEDWNNEDPNDEDLMPENYNIGEEALDRIGMSLSALQSIRRNTSMH